MEEGTLDDSALRRDPFAIVGTLVERKYRVDRVVARGGFGVVYAGHHLGLDVPVAIKVLKPASETSDDAFIDLLAQFLDEARTLARLRHPNIVAVLDAGVAHLDDMPAGVPWMVLEWLEGETLRDDLTRRRGRGGRTPVECMDLVRPILEAMADAHHAGIAHRDLKPSNVMLAPSRRGVVARVLDFGIAKLMQPDGSEAASSGDTATESRVSSFTAASAAPEQLSGARTGPWTDVFALGLLLTELLTDAPPLPTDDPNEHYRAVFAPERPTPRRLGVDAGAWERVLSRALAVRPSDRQANARELLEELERELGGATARRIVAPESKRDDVGESAHESGFSATDRRVNAARTDGRTRRSAGAERMRRLRWTAAIGGAFAVASSALAAPAPHAELARAGAAIAGPAACTSNRACTTTLGRAAVCKRDVGECVALESQDCTVAADARALESDDTVWIGAMFPKTGPDATEYGLVNHHAIELARQDFAQVMTGVSGARPLGVIACDDAPAPARAADHLARRVGVPAVVGFRSSVEAMDLANSTFVPSGTLAVPAINTNPLVTMVPQPPRGPRLVWRTTYSTTDAASAVGRFVEDKLEPSMRRDGVVGQLRVALLRPKQAAGAALADALFTTLRFNGKSALANGASFRELTFADAPDPAADLAAATSALAELRPHVVVYAGGRSVVRGVIEPLEARLPAGAPRPTYVSIAALYRDVLDFVGRDPSRRRRFFGVTPMADSPANARLVMHYGEVFSEPITRSISPNSTYDAFYMIAYASYAVRRDEPVTGTALAEAVGQLVPPGRPVEVGLSGIFEAYAALQAGERIDLTGATGKLDFDLARGEAAFDHSILCVGNDQSGRAIDGVPSGLTYVATTQKLEGALRCP